MNLETRLEPRLWEAISTSIENRNYKGAILDSIHLLSDVIRDRSGLEGDGVQLVGAAFGGSSPKLKVNKLQTETEQNVQRGVEALLRGLYQAIRNPRSHGSHVDDERDATAILLFVDYLLRVVDQARSPFSLSTLVLRVFDPGFVPKARYAELMVAEIPDGKRLPTCREIIARRSEADVPKLAFFMKALLEKMPESELDEVYELLSDELRQADSEETIRFVLGAFPSEHWPRISEIARMRTEHKLIASVKAGKRLATGKCVAGGLGTWAENIVDKFTLRDELWRAVIQKWRSEDQTEREYGLFYFGGRVRDCFPEPPRTLIAAVNHRLKAGDEMMKQWVEAWSGHISADSMNGPWGAPFADAIRAFVAEQPTVDPITDDDIPF